MSEPAWCNRIYQGDCLRELDRVPDGAVQLAFADPPFNIGYDYDIYQDRLACDAYLDWSRRWIEMVARKLASDGSFWLAIGDEYAAELKVLAHREIGLHPRGWIVWYYTFGVHCKKKFTRSHVHLLYFVKHNKQFTFNDSVIRVPSARQRIYADKRADPRGRVPDDTWILRPQEVPDGFMPDHDTWYVSRVCGTFRERAGWHGCQMPEEILKRIILACSNPGDVVLDPFAGSGTTLVVAKKLGRRFVGCELSSEYSARIAARLAAVAPGQPLEGGDPPRVEGRRTNSPRRHREHQGFTEPSTD